jgi:hypothetical protein
MELTPPPRTSQTTFPDLPLHRSSSLATPSPQTTTTAASVPGVPGRVSSFCGYHAEEDEFLYLFCFITDECRFLYAAPQRRPLPSSRR